ncbi:MAG: cytochrome C [Cyclobacteriaceae bacterium]
MADNDFFDDLRKYFHALVYIMVFMAIFPVVTYWAVSRKDSATDTIEEALEKPENEVVDGLHVASGLIADTGYETVLTNCTKCHSSKLVIQNRASREGWESMIRWMQETQKLWDLGENETIILDYLSKNYAPEKKGRRAPLKGIEWYELED